MTSGERIVEIFTDGACSGNPGPGGWGIVLRYGEVEKEIYGSDPSTTNNRMELTAVIRALEALKRPSAVRIWSDSQYVVMGARDSLPTWRSNGWLTKSKKPVKNIDLWEKLDELARQHTIEWEWVRGHDGHIDNERADRLAVRGAQEAMGRPGPELGRPTTALPYHPSDLFSVREQLPSRSIDGGNKNSCITVQSDSPSTGDQCRHELPVGQCDYCRALPPGVLPRGYRTRGGRAYHNDQHCQWLLEGQVQSARQGKNTHDIVQVSWHAVDPAELQPCEWCCTHQWVRKHHR